MNRLALERRFPFCVQTAYFSAKATVAPRVSLDRAPRNPQPVVPELNRGRQDEGVFAQLRLFDVDPSLMSGDI